MPNIPPVPDVTVHYGTHDIVFTVPAAQQAHYSIRGFELVGNYSTNPFTPSVSPDGFTLTVSDNNTNMSGSNEVYDYNLQLTVNGVNQNSPTKQITNESGPAPLPKP